MAFKKKIGTFGLKALKLDLNLLKSKNLPTLGFYPNVLHAYLLKKKIKNKITKIFHSSSFVKQIEFVILRPIHSLLLWILAFKKNKIPPTISTNFIFLILILLGWTTINEGI
jgi:hypothetical protein